MHWIQNYQLFLFDFDGLLVNTEHLHFQAYINTCAKRGFHLKWSFYQFCEVAHIGGEAIPDALYAEFPEMRACDPDWSVFYADKKSEYKKLLLAGKIELMPGAGPLLQALQTANIRRCVVTNSPREQIEIISSYLPILKTIPHWVTRELYEKAKPHPECYLKAIQLYAKPNDRIIGFEDSVRGLKALSQTSARAVLICESHYPLLNVIQDEYEALHHYETLDAIPESGP